MRTQLFFSTTNNLRTWFKHSHRTLFIIQILLISVFTSCEFEESEYEKQVKYDDEQINDYLSQNNVVAQKHPSGFYYEELVNNDQGTVLKSNDVVSFYYKISLLDGKVVQELVKGTDAPAQFKIWNYVIVPVGLDDAIMLMKTGEKYRFYMPSNLAYGSYYCKEFNSNSNFIIDIEVVKTESESAIEEAQIDSIQNYLTLHELSYQKTNTGLYFLQKSFGQGESPLSISRVTIDFTRRYLNDTVIKSITDVTLNLGNNEAVKGLEEGLLLMKAGGEAQLIMPASLGFKQSLCIVPEKIRAELLADKMISSEVKPYSIIKYDVKLKTVY